MSNGERNSPARSRAIENARLLGLDADLRAFAALALDEYLAARRVDETVIFDEADLDLWVAGHADLVARVASIPAGDTACAHVFGLRKATPRTVKRDDEARRGGWLVAPCTCGRVAA